MSPGHPRGAEIGYDFRSHLEIELDFGPYSDLKATHTRVGAQWLWLP